MSALFTVAVGSLAKEKLDAAIQGVKASRVPPRFTQIRVVGTGAESGVREQPELLRFMPDGTIDYETKRGADNRANHAADRFPGADLYLGIENGVGPLGFIADLAVIVAVHRASGRRAYATSPGVAFPRTAYEITKSLGFEKHTVGSTLAARDTTVDGKNPHLSLTGVSRVDLLAHGITLAVNTLCLDLKRAEIPLVG